MTAFADVKALGESAASAVLERVGRGVSRLQERTPLPHDVLESDDAYLVVFDAPGTARSDVQVRFVEGAVEVRIDRFRDFREGFEMRFPGRGLSLDGRAELPADADVDPRAATATLTDSGTLRVRVPKVVEGDDERDVPDDDATEFSEDDEVGAADFSEDDRVNAIDAADDEKPV